jgi:hypothetical protein
MEKVGVLMAHSKIVSDWGSTMEDSLETRV